jgi:hypothetical protein
MLTILTLALAGSLVVASPAAADVGELNAALDSILNNLGAGGILNGAIGG